MIDIATQMLVAVVNRTFESWNRLRVIEMLRWEVQGAIGLDRPTRRRCEWQAALILSHRIRCCRCFRDRLDT